MCESESSTSIATSYEVHAFIDDFFSEVRNGTIEIYNEFSLQHEFGIYLRKRFVGYKVQFERNVEYFGFEKSDFVKKEVDVSIFSDNNSDLACVFELKYPRNGQHPEQMYSFCKDIRFLEQLVNTGFKKAYFVVAVDDSLFYSGSKKDGIYAYFRSNRPIEGNIRKPTGRSNESICVQGSYHIDWRTIQGKSKYGVVEVS